MRITRRDVLALSSFGAVGAFSAFVTACGGGGSSQGQPWLISRRFPNTVLVPGTVRLPMSIGSVNPATNSFAIEENGPGELTGRLVDVNGTTVLDGLRAPARRTGVPFAHYTFTPTIESPGIYTLMIDGADPNGSTIEINDPANVTIPLVGTQLAPFDTPTVIDGRGVNPICTREPGCPFHQHTLTDALATGKPVAYLIGTPAYCQTGVCGPILDLLMNEASKRGDSMSFVHAEVYTDDSATSHTAALSAYNLTFEPVLFVADAGGKLTARLDATMDADEISAALDTAT